MKKTTKTTAAQRASESRRFLDRCRRERAIVRIWRGALDGAGLDAYVHLVGKELFVVEPVTDRITLDGYEVLRLKDVSRVALAPHASFLQRALELRHFAPKVPARVRLTDVSAALRSICRHYPLVAVHREHVAPDVCEVGKLLRVSTTEYVLREVDPDAKWEKGTTSRPLSQITKIDFNGGYETALALVAGSAP